MSDERPAFEVRTRDGRVMAIYASGRIEGFPPEYSIIINRIPTVWVERDGVPEIAE